jgi:hypothetical protein
MAGFVRFSSFLSRACLGKASMRFNILNEKTDNHKRRVFVFGVRRKDLGKFSGRFVAANIPPHGSMMLAVTPATHSEL